LRPHKSLYESLGKKGSQAEALADRVMKNPASLPEVFEGITSANPRVKFGSAKILRIISERNPEILYPEIDLFVKLLDSENNILRWNAMDDIANLTSVDSQNRFDSIFKKYYGSLLEGSLITAAHVVDNSGKIANAKPHLRNKITNELLKAAKIPLSTEECRNILLGKVILSFCQYVDEVKNKEKMISLAKRLLNNTRSATRVKAEKFLKRIGPEK
jgi:hypothetical protein